MAEAFANADSVAVEDTLKLVGDVAWRPRLPKERPKGHSGLWSVLKSAIGKDLTRITLPVHFNEPLSFLQRLSEDLEASHLLDKAASIEDPVMRLVYVSAFANSFWSSTGEGHRIYKPFNPLLGETYELVRDGYRCILEQVSHHPPISAIHVESKHGWIFSQEYRCETKFRGTLKVTAQGSARVFIEKFGDRYVYCKPATTVHNLVFGKLWTDNDGDLVVKNYNSGERCVMHWQPYGSVGKKYTQLTGEVYDKDNTIAYTLHGSWYKGLVLFPGHVTKLPDGMTIVDKADQKDVIWKTTPPPEGSKDMYGMGTFTMGLNQVLPGVAPTDSRLRADQRALEDGDLNTAAAAKRALEEKQRAARKEREKAKKEWSPRWFVASEDKDTGNPMHIYKGGYWDARHSGDFVSKPGEFPDIFVSSDMSPSDAN